MMLISPGKNSQQYIDLGYPCSTKNCHKTMLPCDGWGQQIMLQVKVKIHFMFTICCTLPQIILCLHAPCTPTRTTKLSSHQTQALQNVAYLTTCHPRNTMPMQLYQWKQRMPLRTWGQDKFSSWRERPSSTNNQQRAR